MNGGENKNKYLVPTIIVAVLLIIATVLLALVSTTTGPKSSGSVSKGNVVGGANKTTQYALPARGYSLLSLDPVVPPLSAVNAGSAQSERFTIAWWNANSVEREFFASNMVPGETRTIEYYIKIRSYYAKSLSFSIVPTDEKVNTDPSNGNEYRISDVMNITVSANDSILYDGLLKDIDEELYCDVGALLSEQDIKFVITASLPSSVNNNYANLYMKADFNWKLTESGTPSPGGTTPVAPDPVTMKETFNGNKVLKGREWREGDEFTFVLEEKKVDGTYEKIIEKTATYTVGSNENGSIEFSEEFGKYLFKDSKLYEFRIREIAGNANGIKYDTSIKTFQVYIRDTDNDGRFEVADVAASGMAVSKSEDGAYRLAFEFVNEYDPSLDPDAPGHGGSGGEEGDDDKKLEIKIPINNTVDFEVDNGDTSEGHMFVLENVETGERIIVTTDKDGKAEFVLNFTGEDAGKTFKYKAYAYDNGDENVDHSDKVYDIEIMVLADPSAEGGLKAVLKVDGVVKEPHEVELNFSTFVYNNEETTDTEPVDPYENRDPLPPILMTLLIIFALEIIWLVYMIRKYKEEDEEWLAGGTKLYSLAAPVIFCGYLVPRWEVIALYVLIAFTLGMLAANLTYFFRRRYVVKSRSTAEEKEGENDAEKTDSAD